MSGALSLSDSVCRVCPLLGYLTVWSVIESDPVKSQLCVTPPNLDIIFWQSLLEEAIWSYRSIVNVEVSWINGADVLYHQRLFSLDTRNVARQRPRRPDFFRRLHALTSSAEVFWPASDGTRPSTTNSLSHIHGSIIWRFRDPQIRCLQQKRGGARPRRRSVESVLHVR